MRNEKNKELDLEKNQDHLTLSLKQWFVLFISVVLGFFTASALSNISLSWLHFIPSFKIHILLSSLSLVFLVFVILLLIKLYNLSYRVSFWEICGFLYLTNGYIGLRLFFDSEEWDLINIFDTKHFTYIDVVTIVALLSFLILAVRSIFFKTSSITKENTFLEDNPVSTKELKGDSTYNHLISKITPALFKDVYNSSFSIGVIGPWGTGKSSFLKAVEYTVCKASEKELKENYDVDHKPDTIFIEFSPFLNHNEEQVIHEFFTQLSNKLSERSGRLSNLITVYSEKLANLEDKNPWFSLFKLARNSRESRSAQELYDQIEACIRELNIKIIVAVDDLDRLNAQEILQVLKLIRNTSNFPNMVFLVALDKEYVTNALKGEKEYMKERYLDKFFQLEISVSYPNIDSVLNFMINEIYWKLKDHPSSGGMFTLTTQKLFNQKSFLSDYLITYRDVKKFTNQFYYDYNILNQGKYLDIDFHDLVYMTLLKIFCPNMMNLILSRSYHLVNNEGYFVGFKTKKDLTPKHEIKEVKHALCYDGVEENKQNNSTEKELIINGSPASLYEVKLLMKVFGLDSNHGSNADSIPLNSITRYKTLRLYKHHVLSEGELKESDYKNITLLPYGEFKSKLTEISDDDTLLKIAYRQYNERSKFASDYKEKYFRLLEIYFSISEPSSEILRYLSQMSSELSQVTSDRLNFIKKIKGYFLERLENEVYINHTVQLFRELVFKSFNSQYIDNFSKIIESINKSYLKKLKDKIELMFFYNYLVFLKSMKDSPLPINNLLGEFEDSIEKMEFSELIQVFLIYPNERKFEIRYQPILLELFQSVENINQLIKTHDQFDRSKYPDLSNLLDLIELTGSREESPLFYDLKGFNLNNERSINKKEVKQIILKLSDGPLGQFINNGLELQKLMQTVREVNFDINIAKKKFNTSQKESLVLNIYSDDPYSSISKVRNALKKSLLTFLSRTHKNDEINEVILNRENLSLIHLFESDKNES